MADESKPEGERSDENKPEGADEIKAAFHSVAVKAVGDLFDSDHSDTEAHKACMKAIKTAHKGYVNHVKAMDGQEGSEGDNDDDADDKPEGDKAVEIEVVAPELMEKVAKIETVEGRVKVLESAVATMTTILDGLTK